MSLLLKGIKTMDIKELLAYCDHTLLRVDCTEAEIRKLCDQAIKYGCASVCIPPCHVPGAKRYVGDKMKICTVIGFPNGYMSTAAKAFEAADAVANGADEIDMVINLSMVKDGCWEDVAEDIKAVRRSCLGKVLKVIIECCLLTDEEKMRMCTIVSECGADFIKTSTGFSKGGATRHDVELLRRCSPDSLQVKAAGGIASLEDAEDFISLGATRLGTSRIVKLAMELERESAGTDTGSENY
jgi:deoxyribose-phosphate aldolase